jgi:uncharacterized protein YdeI (YjbR/CyaY-like superfamily)
MATVTKEFQHVEPKSRSEWRNWLQQNHTQKAGIRLVLYKKGTSGSTLTISEAVEEALCFGWIDSVANGVDDKRYKIHFSPRKPKSIWSKINKARVAKLIKAQVMHPAGLAMVKLAKKTGTWNALNDIDALKYPADLITAFIKNKKAKTFFDAFPPSTKKQILWWIKDAKTEETRARRIKETVEKAANNIRANQYVKKE